MCPSVPLPSRDPWRVCVSRALVKSRKVQNSHFPVRNVQFSTESKLNHRSHVGPPAQQPVRAGFVPPRYLRTRAEGVDALPTRARGPRPGEGRRARAQVACGRTQAWGGEAWPTGSIQQPAAIPELTGSRSSRSDSREGTAPSA